MPLIQVSLAEGRSPTQIRELIRGLTDVTAEVAGAEKDAIRVIVTEVPASHWGLGELTLEEKRAHSPS